MHWYDWAGIGVLATMAAALIILFPLSIGKNLAQGHRYRKKLADRIEHLSMGRMLQKLGIDEYKFLHEQDGVHLKREISRCETCEVKEKCEEELNSHERLETKDIAYCPNRDALEESVKTQTG